MNSFRECHFIVIGFLIGSAIVSVPLFFYNQHNNEQKARAHDKVIELMKLHHSTMTKQVYNDSLLPKSFFEAEFEQIYNESLSQVLFDTVKVLCMVMTHPENHRTKAIHVRDTWGKRCNKLIFMSSQDDLQLDVVVLPLEESRANLWNKTKAGFRYLHDHHIDDYDWFLKADDDNYIVIENLRYMLAQYNPNTALYFGHRYAAKQVEEGYMAGGGYILSKKAVKKFVQKLILDPKQCHPKGGAEDLEMGRCLAHHAIFVDCRDELHQKRFFPVGPEEHMKAKVKPDYWYTVSQYYHVPQGNTSCCSDTSAEYHYINPHQMYALEYFIYRTDVFGLDDHSTETLPKKLSLNEIIAASDVQSTSPNFNKHRIRHHIDPDERYTVGSSK